MKFLRKLFDHEYKELKRFTAIADKIIELDDEYGKLSDEELQAKTEEFKKRYPGKTLASVNVCSTHTHSCVDTEGLWTDFPGKILRNRKKNLKKNFDLEQGTDKEYMMFLKNAVVNAFFTAIENMCDGEMYFAGRKDFQIKHMGHRIELGEIEANVNLMEGISLSCCIYDTSKSKIHLFYVGEIEEKELYAILKEKLPRYMLPSTVNRLSTMPLTANGKLDRMSLKKQFENT